jgi:hypothetical protein
MYFLLARGACAPESAQQAIHGQPRWRAFCPDHGAIGTPRPVLGPRDHPGPHGVEHDIARQLQEVDIFLDEYRFVTPLKNMSDPTMAAIDALRKDAVELAHACGKVSFDRLHHEMVVVAHQAVGVTRPIEALADRTQDVQPGNAILVARVDVLPSVTTRRDVVQTSGKFDA